MHQAHVYNAHGYTISLSKLLHMYAYIQYVIYNNAHCARMCQNHIEQHMILPLAPSSKSSKKLLHFYIVNKSASSKRPRRHCASSSAMSPSPTNAAQTATSCSRACAKQFNRIQKALSRHGIALSRHCITTLGGGGGWGWTGVRSNPHLVPFCPLASLWAPKAKYIGTV